MALTAYFSDDLQKICPHIYGKVCLQLITKFLNKTMFQL